MENNQDFEERIRSDLKTKGNEISPSDESYSKIIDDFLYIKGSKFRMFKNRFLYINKKRLLVATLCIAIAISFGTSSNLRAFATETVNKIKTIFIVEGTDENYKVSEQPADKPIFSTGNSKITNLNDDELSKKVGFKISFPKLLCNDFNLISKSEMIVLNKLSYENIPKVRNNIFKAIDDVEAFKNLAEYNPSRAVCAEYIKDDVNISIFATPNINEFKSQISSAKYTKVDINGLEGYWLGLPLATYPSTKLGEPLQNDMSQKPTEIKTAHTLFWFSNGVCYQMVFSPDKELSMDQTIAIAKSFIAQSSK
jgi:hypothetical protein